MIPVYIGDIYHWYFRANAVASYSWSSCADSLYISLRQGSVV